jgi:hypothetical protein
MLYLKECDDSYGFFTIPSHDRLILLNSGPLLKRLAPTSAGPPSASPDATSLSALPPVPTPIKEASRIAKWTRMLIPHKRSPGGNVETWRIKPSKASKLRERTYKGVPDRWRGAAWDLMMTGYSGMTPQGLERLIDEYHDALEKPSSYDIQIDLDVPRTISGHIMFKTRYGAGYVFNTAWLKGDLIILQTTFPIPRPPLLLAQMRDMRVRPRHGPNRCYPALLL